MFRYILEGWKRELDQAINSEWQEIVLERLVKEKYIRNDLERRMMYKIMNLIRSKTECGDMLPSFEEFAIVYAEHKVKKQLDGYEIYR